MQAYCGLHVQVDANEPHYHFTQNRPPQQTHRCPLPNTHLLMQGSQKAWPQRSTNGFFPLPSPLLSLFPPFLSLLPLPGTPSAVLTPLLLPAAPPAPASPPSRGADRLLLAPPSPFSSSSYAAPPGAAAARRATDAERELPASADPAGAEGLGGAGAGERATAAARAAAAAPAAVRGASKSSRQMGQLLAAYCWLRMAD